MIESNRNKELEELIDEYVEGNLTSEQTDELWAKLIENEYYLDYLKSVANLKKIASNRSKETSGIRKIGQAHYWTTAAAALLLIVGSVVVFDLSTQSSETVTPITSIELDYYRSAEGVITEEGESDVIRRAISTANTGEVDQALQLIDDELAANPGPYLKAELLITAGSILYNSAHFNESIDRFENALEIDHGDVMLNERNYWYLGNAYFQINQLDEAKAALEKAFELNGAYSRVAQSYLRALSAR